MDSLIDMSLHFGPLALGIIPLIISPHLYNVIQLYKHEYIRWFWRGGDACYLLK